MIVPQGGSHRTLVQFAQSILFRFGCAIVAAFASTGCSASSHLEAGRQFYLTAQIGDQSVAAAYSCPAESVSGGSAGALGPSPEHRAVVKRSPDVLIILTTRDAPELFCRPGQYRLGAPDDDFQIWTISRNGASIRAANEQTAIILVEEQPAEDGSAAMADLIGEFRLTYHAAAIFEVGLRPIANIPVPGSSQQFDHQFGERGDGPSQIAHTDAARFCDDLGQSILLAAKRLPDDDYRRIGLTKWLRRCSDGEPTFGGEVIGQNPSIQAIIGSLKSARLEGDHWVYSLSGTRGDGYVKLCELDGEPCLSPAPDLVGQGPAELTLRSEEAELRVAIPSKAGDGPGALMFRDPDARNLLIFPATHYQLFEVRSS